MLQDFKSEIKLFIIVALITIVVAVAGILLFAYFNKSAGINPIIYAQCNQLEQEIDTLVKRANYCEVDENCVVGPAIPGRCWDLANKNADVASIQKKSLQRQELNCDKGVVYEQCLGAPQILKCQQNKCVGAYYRPTTVQELKESPALFHTRNVLVEGIYRWGFEFSELDEIGSPEHPKIWVEIDEGKTKIQNKPSDFTDIGNKHHGGTAKVTIYGTFHAYDPIGNYNELPSRGNFGHLGLWQHQIVADKIVFESEVEAITHKIAYSPNEDVAVEIKNNSTKDIWIQGLCGVPFILQQYNIGEWKDYGPNPTKKCSPPPRQNIKAGTRLEYRITNLPQMYGFENSQIESGRYRFLFRYSFANLNLAGQKAQFFDAFSNEFTIGEQQISQLNARIVGSYASPGESSKVAVSGNVAYVTDISQGLLTIDVSDPTNPKLLDSIKIEGGGAYAVAIGLQSPKKPIPAQLFVSGYGNSKLMAIDVSDPKNLKIVARGEAKRSIQNMISFGTNLYLAIDGPEFEVISTELNWKENYGDGGGVFKPGKIIAATPGGHVLKLEPSLTKLLAAQGEKGLAIFELGQDFPTLEDSIDVGGYAYDVAAYGAVSSIPFREFAYVITPQELIIVDVTVAGSPKIKNRLSLAGTGEAIDLVNGIAAVAMWEKGVELINIQDPDHPVSIGVVDTPGRARDVTLQYNQQKNVYYMYVADDRDDLQIIEVRK